MDNFLDMLEENIEEFKKINQCENKDIIIILNSKAFSIIKKNLYCSISNYVNEPFSFFTSINGVEVSKKIRDDLPENMDFIIQLKEDYERNEIFRRNNG